MSRYDVFFSHNHADKPAVEALALRLRDEKQLNVWLDSWYLVAGEAWQDAIEEALDESQTVAVFLGASGIGPWENEEMRSALEERVRNKTRRVLPILLPGAPDPRVRPLPRFLRRLTWIDFRSGLDNAGAFHHLVSGIKGIAPGPRARSSSNRLRYRPVDERPTKEESRRGVVSSRPHARPMVPIYRPFDLRLSLTDEKQLHVEVVNAPAGDAVGTALLPVYRSDDVAPNKRLNLASIGVQIGQALLPGDVRLCYEASLARLNAPHEGLRLRLRYEDHAIAAIPWEAAHIGQDYLSLRPRTPLVRYVYAQNPPTPLAVSPPLRVLGILSSPFDQPPLNIQAERTQLEKALAPLIKSGQIELKWLASATVQHLQEALRQGIHMIHFIGHGTYDDHLGQGLLFFENQKRLIAPLPADWLASLLRDSTVRFVFINACESGHAVGGLTEVLVQRGVPAALGMQSNVADNVAIAFATGFYRALSDGWPVDAATVEGRRAIVNAKGNNLHQPDWVQPILYMRAPDGKILDVAG